MRDKGVYEPLQKNLRVDSAISFIYDQLKNVSHLNVAHPFKEEFNYSRSSFKEGASCTKRMLNFPNSIRLEYCVE